jgi:hypothetical protein
MIRVLIAACQLTGVKQPILCGSFFFKVIDVIESPIIDDPV